MSYRETVAEQDFWVLIWYPAAGSQNSFEKVTDRQIQEQQRECEEAIFTHVRKTTTKFYIRFLLIKWSKSSAIAFPIATAISIQLRILKPTLHQSLPVMYRWGTSWEASWGKHLLSKPNIHQPCHETQQPQRLSPRNMSRGCSSMTANILHNILGVDKALFREVGDAGSLPVSFWGDLSHISQECICHQLKVKHRLENCLSCLLKPYFCTGEEARFIERG